MPDSLKGVAWVTLLVDILVAFFGLFQLAFTATVRLGWSFNTLWWLQIPVLIGTAATVYWVNRPPDSPPQPVSQPADFARWQARAMWLTAPLLILGAVLWDADVIGYRTLWGVVILHLGLQLPGTTSGMSWNRERLDLGSGLLLLIAMIGGGLASLAINRPEGDDGYYVSQAIGTTEHPELALMSFDTMHNRLDWPVQQVAHKAQGFETWCSVLFELIPLPHFDLYYLWQPFFFACCIAVANFVFARALVGKRAAAMGTLLVLGVLVLWGGAYYGVGNFSYARIFQGKGVLVGVFLPLLAHRALHFTAEPTAQTWWMLLLAQCAAAFCTSTALVVAPICAAFVVLAGLTPDKKGALLAVGGLMSAVPVVLMLWLVKLDVDGISDRASTGLRRGVREWLGGDGHSAAAFMLLLLVPLLVRLWRGNAASWVTRYLFLAFLLLVNEYTTGFIADRGGDLLSWRTYWALPVGALMAAGLGATAELTVGDAPASMRRLALGTLVAWGAAFAVAGPATWEKPNNARVAWMEHKIRYQQNLVAKTIMRKLGPDDLVVGPDTVMLRLAMYEGKPNPAAVRRIYSEHLRPIIGDEEFHAHRVFLDFGDGLKRTDFEAAFRLFDERCVTGVTFKPALRKHFPQVTERLKRRHFIRVPVRRHTAGYQFWMRDASSCNAPDKVADPPRPVPSRKEPSR